jgi:type IV secretory pathway TraG/TraD family ATPase VirD4
MDTGAVVVLQPEPRQASDLAARAIKAKWYEAATSRSDMERPVGVVCDEFQRFITLDPVSGDANFLDTARAYRVNCVFATQSVAALELALGSGPKAKAAVAAILCNTPSKWFFASKDSATVQELRDLIPPSPGGRHVVDVRPPAQLRPGEAYWSLANGQWGRGRANLAQLR